jgi:hypothetical protein
MHRSPLRALWSNFRAQLSSLPAVSNPAPSVWALGRFECRTWASTPRFASRETIRFLLPFEVLSWWCLRSLAAFTESQLLTDLPGSHESPSQSLCQSFPRLFWVNLRSAARTCSSNQPSSCSSPTFVALTPKPTPSPSLRVLCFAQWWTRSIARKELFVYRVQSLTTFAFSKLL